MKGGGEGVRDEGEEKEEEEEEEKERRNERKTKMGEKKLSFDETFITFLSYVTSETLTNPANSLFLTPARDRRCARHREESSVRSRADNYRV